MACRKYAETLPQLGGAYDGAPMIGLLARPFAGIPLTLRDDVYRPIFLFMLCIGLSAGLWLNFVSVWLSQDLGATPTQVGWFFSAGFMAAALGNFTMPLLAERVGSRKRVTLGLVLIGGPSLLAMALANGYWMALIAILPLWFGAALFALMIGVVGDVARERAGEGGRSQAGSVIAALQTASALGIAVGPLPGGWLYERLGDLRPAMLLAVLPNLAALWILWRYLKEDGGPTAAGRPTDGRAERRSAPVGPIGLPLLVFLALIVWFKLADSRGPFETLYAAEGLGAGQASVGLLITTIAVLQLVLTPVTGPLADKLGAGRATALGMACLGAHGLLLAGTTAYWQQLALLALSAFGLAISTTAPFLYAQQLAPGRASTATGWLNACFFLGLTGGSTLAGRLTDVLGFRGLFLFSGALDLLAAALVIGLVVWTGRPAYHAVRLA